MPPRLEQRDPARAQRERLQREPRQPHDRCPRRPGSAQARRRAVARRAGITRDLACPGPHRRPQHELEVVEQLRRLQSACDFARYGGGGDGTRHSQLAEPVQHLECAGLHGEDRDWLRGLNLIRDDCADLVADVTAKQFFERGNRRSRARPITARNCSSVMLLPARVAARIHACMIARSESISRPSMSKMAARNMTTSLQCY